MSDIDPATRVRGTTPSRGLRRSLLAFAMCCACGDEDPGIVVHESCQRFVQWGGNAAHSGAQCVIGQPMKRTLQRIVIDPFAKDEALSAEGDLLVHYQAPLIVGDDVYLMAKSGTFTACDPEAGCAPYSRHSQIWSEQAYRWQAGELVRQWTFTSDWKPEPEVRFEPMFQPAIAGDFIYIPGLGGSVHKVDRLTGQAVTRIQPFGDTLDPDLYVAGGLAADDDGNIYYTALKLDHDAPYTSDASGWIVKVRPDDGFTARDTHELATGAPDPGALCRDAFPNDTPRPLPPADDANGIVLPPEVPCRSQRPLMNLVPAIGADGTVFLVTRAHGAARTSFFVALNADLSPKWARSLSRIFADGCGVTIPMNGSEARPSGCRPGARPGVDPRTNELPSVIGSDQSSSSPVALPDGSVLYGATTSYNGARGHLIKLDARGEISATHDFGWDVTPAIWQHDGTYSVIIKNNTYTRDQNGVLTGPFYLEQLDRDLKTEWRYQLTNTKSCVRSAGGDVACIDDHPNGFEWCINAPVVDARGTVYGTGEDGNAYAIAQGGKEKHRLFLEMSIGAAYTPLALDREGRIYTLNDGMLKVLGR